jgi:hypothetical protein
MILKEKSFLCYNNFPSKANLTNKKEAFMLQFNSFLNF